MSTWAHQRCHPMAVNCLCIFLGDTRWQNKLHACKMKRKWWEISFMCHSERCPVVFHPQTNSIPVSLSLSEYLFSVSPCAREEAEQWEEFFLLCLLLPSLFSLFLSLKCLSSPCLTLVFPFGFLVSRGVVLILHSRKWEDTAGQGAPWDWITIVPSGLSVFFTSLLAAHKSAKLLINGTARCHIFPSKYRVNSHNLASLKNETITSGRRVLKELLSQVQLVSYMAKQELQRKTSLFLLNDVPQDNFVSAATCSRNPSYITDIEPCNKKYLEVERWAALPSELCVLRPFLSIPHWLAHSLNKCVLKLINLYFLASSPHKIRVLIHPLSSILLVLENNRSFLTGFNKPPLYPE